MGQPETHLCHAASRSVTLGLGGWGRKGVPAGGGDVDLKVALRPKGVLLVFHQNAYIFHSDCMQN